MTEPDVVPAAQLGQLDRRAAGTTTADLSRVAVNIRQPLEDLDQAYRLSVMLAQSNLVPWQLQGKPQNVLIVIMTGLELGLTVTQALRSVYVTSNGMPGLRGEMLLGKLRQAGHDYDYSEPTAEGCTFRLHRGHEAPLDGFADKQCGKGRDYFGKFTLEDAKRARLVRADQDGNLIARSSKGEPMPHELYGPDMMFWRAMGRGVRRGAPEITLGFTIAETMDGEQPAPGLPVPAQAGPPSAPTAAMDMTAGPPPDVRAEVLDLERQMTGPAHHEDGSQVSSGGPAHARDDSQGTDGGPAVMQAPAAGADTHQASGESQGGRDRGNRGAPPPPPQAEPPARQDLSWLPGFGPEDTDPEPVPGFPVRLINHFGRMGWSWDRHRATILNAVTECVRRPVRDLASLPQQEAETVAAELSRLMKVHDEEHWPVALADAAEKWREDWQAADPGGYAEAHPD